MVLDHIDGRQRVRVPRKRNKVRGGKNKNVEKLAARQAGYDQLSDEFKRSARRPGSLNRHKQG